MAGPPPIREPIIGKNGKLTPVWEKYFTLTLSPDSTKLLEEIRTSFTTGSIPVVGTNYLIEDNPGLAWSTLLRQLILSFDVAAFTTLGTDTDGFFRVASSGGKTYLEDLTDNGFVKTINGDGELEVDTKTYVPGIPGTAQGELFFWDDTLEQLVPCDVSERFWDDVNKRLGIGTITPTTSIQVIGTARFGDQATNYAEFSADGSLEFTGTANYYVGDNKYAFKSKSTANVGLFFNAATSSLDLVDTLSASVIKMYLDGSILCIKGGAFGDLSGGNYAYISGTGDLQLNGTADYLIGDNRYAFRAVSDQDTGIYFDVTNLRIVHKDLSGNDAFWVDVNNGDAYIKRKLGIGTITPEAALEILATTKQLRLTHTDAVDFCDFLVNSDGDLSITPSSRNLYLGDGTAGDSSFNFYGATTIYSLIHDDADGTLRLSANDLTNFTQFGARGQITLPAGTAAAGTAPLKLTAGTLLTTPEPGTIEYDGDRTYLTNIAVRKAIDRSNDVITTTTTVSNTVVETTLWTGIIGPNGLTVGNLIKISGAGILSTATASDDITLNVYIDSTLIMTFNPAIGNVTDEHWHVNTEIIIRTIGAAGTLAYHGDMYVAGSDDSEIGLASAINSTTQSNITIKCQWDNAKVGNTISIYTGYMEVKN